LFMNTSDGEEDRDGPVQPHTRRGIAKGVLRLYAAS